MRLSQISLANSDLLADGVALIISTAAGTVISLALALHGHYGRKPLPQAGGALALVGRIVLAGPSAHAQPFEYHPQAGVARSAIPDQVFGIGVLLESVQVAHFDVATAAAECTNLVARWLPPGSL